MAIEYPRSADYDGLVQQLTAARNEIHRLNRRLESGDRDAGVLRNEYRRLSTYAQEVLFTTEPEGALTYVADGVRELLEYDPAELIGRRIQDVLPLSEGKAFDGLLAEISAGHEEWFAHRTLARSKSGRSVPVLVVAMRLERAEGVVGLLRDFTDYNEQEADLRRHAGILAAITQSAQRFLSATDWRSQVGDFLHEIAAAAGVCRAFLYENYRDLHGRLRSKLLAEWIRRRDPVQPPLVRELSFESGVFRSIGTDLHDHTEIVVARSTAPDAVAEYLSDKRIQTAYVLPVFVEEELWGFLGFDEWYAERKWTDADAKGFRTAVGILGAAIRHGGTSSRLSQIERLVRAQRDTALRLSSVSDIDAALTSVAEGIDCLEMRSVAVRSSVEEDMKVVHVGWSAGLRKRIEEEIGRCFDSDRPGRYYSLGDLLRNRSFRPTVADNVRSLAVLPMSHGGRTIGIIVLGSTGRDYIPEILRETLETIAAETAGVLARIEAEQSARRNRQRVHEANERYALATTAGRVGVWDYRRGKGFHLTAILRSLLHADGVATDNPWPLLLSAVPEEHRGQLGAAVRRMIRGYGDDLEAEVPIRHPEGEILWFSLRANAYRGGEGRIERIIGTATDITSQKRLEERLRRAREAADSSSHAKSRFLATMSHELKTPLNGILGYAQVLQRTPRATQEQRDAVDVIYRSAGHLLRLINDVLDASRLDTGRIELSKAEFNLPVFLQDLSEVMSIQARSKGLRFALVKETNLPVFVNGDEKRLRQIILNLLTNAIKFTSEGGVSLNVGWYDESIRIAVKDTGAGIPKEKLDEVFLPFVKLDRPTENSEGSGLGLPISRQLLKLMGCELYVESTEGGGTEFWFLLPHRPQEDRWDVASAEEYIAPLEEVDAPVDLPPEDVELLVRSVQIGDLKAVEDALLAISRETPSSITERGLRYVREFRIPELRELVFSLGRNDDE